MRPFIFTKSFVNWDLCHLDLAPLILLWWRCNSERIALAPLASGVCRVASDVIAVSPLG